MVLEKSVEKKWESEKKLQKVKEYFFDRINKIKSHILFCILLSAGVRFPAETARNVLSSGQRIYIGLTGFSGY